MFSVAAAVSVVLVFTGAANGEPATATVAPSIQEVTGQGTDACPSMSLCLYQDHNLNADKPARIWIFPVSEERQDFSLREHDAANRPSSGYLNAPGLGWAAYLFPDYTCGFDGSRDAEAIQFHGGRQLNDLDGVNGRAKRYGYFYKNGKWSKTQEWGITEQTLYLNDRAGCISTGSYSSTSELRPPIDGDM
ncbi:hypothetical protein ACYTFC_21200 [Streptomyces globosus]|uniref:hypothetical protein n=1 Tax=Streptomyces globosus TaxID=68209 RepID=UPI000F939FDB|nr:hypothetical protein EF903_06130 [Streptomyces sp. WAC05292]